MESVMGLVNAFFEAIETSLRSIGFKQAEVEGVKVTVWSRGDAKVELIMPLTVEYIGLVYVVKIVCQPDEVDEILNALPRSRETWEKIAVLELSKQFVRIEAKLVWSGPGEE